MTLRIYIAGPDLFKVELECTSQQLCFKPNLVEVSIYEHSIYIQLHLEQFLSNTTVMN